MFGIDDAALGLIAAGALGTAGNIYANQKNIEQQQRANTESINLANTAHQREVLDLIAAGLNPVLSAGGNGSSVPQLGAAQIDNPGEGISRGLSSAMKYASAEYETNLAVKSAQAENLVNQGELFKAEADAIKAGRGGITGAKSLGEKVGDYIGNKIVPILPSAESTSRNTGRTRLQKQLFNISASYGVDKKEAIEIFKKLSPEQRREFLP